MTKQEIITTDSAPAPACKEMLKPSEIYWYNTVLSTTHTFHTRLLLCCVVFVHFHGAVNSPYRSHQDAHPGACGCPPCPGCHRQLSKPSPKAHSASLHSLHRSVIHKWPLEYHFHRTAKNQRPSQQSLETPTPTWRTCCSTETLISSLGVSTHKVELLQLELLLALLQKMTDWSCTGWWCRLRHLHASETEFTPVFFIDFERNAHAFISSITFISSHTLISKGRNKVNEASVWRTKLARK